MNFTHKLNEVKYFGFFPVAKEVMYTAINKLWCFMVLQGMIVTLDSLDHNFLNVSPAHRYTFLSNEEVLYYAQDESNHMSGSFVKGALAKGDKCYGIFEGSNLISYGWYSDSETHINKDLLLYFDPDWIYMYKGYTKVSHRGQRLHAFGMAMALKEFCEMGKKGLISYVEAQNFKSLRSTARMGYQNIGRVRIFQLSNRFRIKAEKSCQPYGFGVREAKHLS
jgi:hypothetical protein